MDNELNELKKVLRSLVVSSPTQVDCATLMRDYRSMVGKPIPLAKYGYKEPVQFLKERCNDCFVMQGQPLNPILTLIVPETLKHIDNFVQKQKVSSTLKHKVKRRSIPVAKSSPPRNLICETFTQNQKQKLISNAKEVKQKYNLEKSIEVNKANNVVGSQGEICSLSSLKINDEIISNIKETNDVQPSDNGICSKMALERFLKKRIPLYNSSQYLESETKYIENDYSKEETDSGRQTSSSRSSAKWTQLEELKMEIRNLIEKYAEGVWCTELIALYRERYGRELNFSRFGYTSVLSMACVLEDNLIIWRPEGSSDWKLLTRSPNMPSNQLSLHPRTPLLTIPSLRKSRDTVDPDDALPGIDFEADVFPEDCMHYLESIPHVELPEESTIEVQVGELYSPSHFWLIRLGEDYNIAMEDLMDEMNLYYKSGEGQERTLARGAVRVGHYCSSCYEGDWHRSLIVRILDSDTVKVRHVDYGTVDRCAVSRLRPLLRRWSCLPQQAIRGRLAGVRPPAAGRRWPRSSAAYLLRRLTDKRLVAQIIARSTEGVLEVLLVDTSTDEDVCINTELVSSGHADFRHDSCLGVSVARGRFQPARLISNRSDSSSTDSGDLDLGSLVTAMSRFGNKDTDTSSEVSVSASQVADPRRLRTWACDQTHSEDSDVTIVNSTKSPVETVASEATRVGSAHLARITALHTRLQNKFRPANGVQEKTSSEADGLASAISHRSNVLRRRVELAKKLNK